MNDFGIKDTDVNEKFGKALEHTVVDKTKGRFNSYIDYISGIPSFDDFLEGVKFANTNCKHLVWVFEKGIFFHLIYEKDQSISCNIWFDEIESLIAYNEQNIEIQKVSNFLRSAASRPVPAGIIPSLVAKGILNATNSIIDKFNKGKSVVVKGTIYEFRIKSRQGDSYTIKVSCIDEHRHEMNKFFDKYLHFDLSKNDPEKKCYIATVCFDDPNSKEVLFFRSFRDNVLRNYLLGRYFINFYYRYSPTLSNILYGKTLIKSCIKNIILLPLYKFLNKFNNR